MSSTHRSGHDAGKATEADARCFVDEAGVEALLAFTAAYPSGDLSGIDPELLGRALRAGTVCNIDPTLGGGIDLAALREECVATGGSACDSLYIVSPLGSEDEELGLTCGGRYEPATAPPTCATELV